MARGPMSYVSTFAAVANTPIKITIPVATLATSLGVPNTNGLGLALDVGALNQGTYQTSTINAWQSGAFLSASGVTNWAAPGNFIALTELQLEAGSAATAFEHRLFGQELTLCARYFQTVQLLTQLYGTAGLVIQIPVVYPVNMRTAPTAGATPSYSNCSAASLATSPQPTARHCNSP